jgi:hypothetical protein
VSLPPLEDACFELEDSKCFLYFSPIGGLAGSFQMAGGFLTGSVALLQSPCFALFCVGSGLSPPPLFLVVLGFELRVLCLQSR